MADQDIGQQVAQWVSRMTTISRNISEISEGQSTRAIKSRFKDPARGYTGITKEKVNAALSTMDNLWQSYLILARVVEEALDLSKKNGMFHDNENRIRELLTGPSVVLPVEYIPVASRSLLDDAEKVQRITPSDLLASMQEQFIAARDTLIRVVEAADRVKPRLEALKEEVATLAKWAFALGADNQAPVDVSQILMQMETDPIGGSIEADSIEADVAKCRARLQSIEDERQAIHASLEGAKALLAELKDLVARSSAAINETRKLIAAPIGLVNPMSDAAIESMEAWVHTLTETLNAGRYDAGKVGISKLVQTCNERLSTERGTYAKNRAFLDEMADLKGRYKALCVKAQVLQCKEPACDSSIRELADQVKHVLDARPFDVLDARQMVGVFEATLSRTKTVE